jgi:hypothetical protein
MSTCGPIGFFLDGTECKKCHDDCYKCDGIVNYKKKKKIFLNKLIPIFLKIFFL